MKEVLILTGACGVGKSTIAEAWAKIKDGATIDCDYLTEWIYKKDFPHWTIEEEKLVAKITAKIAIEYLEFGMSTSIQNVWSPVGIEIIKKEILSHTKANIKVVWLFCSLEENHKRDQLRIPEDQMKERVNIVNEELNSYDWPNYVHKVDSTDLTVEQTLGMIGKY
jgi:shikimate kinase